jgi:hypothetical protein
VYPSPGQSFLIILQPGHAGFRVDFFRKRRLCGFSIAIDFMEFIWWAPFKDTIGSAGTLALATRGWVAHASRVLVAVSRRNELPKVNVTRSKGANPIRMRNFARLSFCHDQIFARHRSTSDILSDFLQANEEGKLCST